MTSSRKRPLRVGLLLPDTEGQLNGADPKWTDIRELALLAEQVGFDSIWVTDHFLNRPYMPTPEQALAATRGPWECWSLVAALAAITRRVEIGTLVLCTGFRNPALLAKMADTVEEISAGRLILGVGAGWNDPEYRAFGYPFDHRVARFEEAIQIITTLLRTGKVDFDGTYSSALDCELRPRGPRLAGPPILIGTTGEKMLDMTARYADQWNAWFSNFNNDVGDLKRLLTRVDAACAHVGRDPLTLARTAAVKIEVGPHNPSTMSVAPVRGSAAEIADLLHEYAAAGISHVQIWPEPNTVSGVEVFARILEELDR